MPDALPDHEVVVDKILLELLFRHNLHFKRIFLPFGGRVESHRLELLQVPEDGAVEVGIVGVLEDDVVEAAGGVDGQADGDAGSGEARLGRPAVEFLLDTGEVTVFNPFVSFLLSLERVTGTSG